VHNLILLCGHHTAFSPSEWEVELVNGRSSFYPPAFIDPRRELGETSYSDNEGLSTNVSSSMTCRLAGSRGKLFHRPLRPSHVPQ